MFISKNSGIWIWKKESEISFEDSFDECESTENLKDENETKIEMEKDYAVMYDTGWYIGKYINEKKKKINVK